MSKKLKAYKLKDTLPYNLKNEKALSNYVSELADNMSACKDKFIALAVSVPNDICPKTANDPISYVANMADTYLDNFNSNIDCYSQCVIINECATREYTPANIEFAVSSEIETYKEAEKALAELVMRESDTINKLKALFYATPNAIVGGNISPFEYVIGKTAEYFDELLDIHEQITSISLLVDNLCLQE